MMDEQKELLSRYTDTVREHQMTTDSLVFQNSLVGCQNDAGCHGRITVKRSAGQLSTARPILIFHSIRNPFIKIGFYNIGRVICTIPFI